MIAISRLVSTWPQFGSTWNASPQNKEIMAAQQTLLLSGLIFFKTEMLVEEAE